MRIGLLLLGGLILVRALFAGQSTLLWWLLPIAIGSLILLGLHQRIFKQQGKARRAVDFYERGLGRLAGNWAGTGETGDRYRNGLHPYAEDLDLFGKGSLFELLCTARTRAGEDIVAAWLLAPATSSEISARQEAVSELRHKLDLREALALLGEALRAGLHPQALSDWGQQQPLPNLKFFRWLTALLCLASALGLGLVFAGFGSVPLTIILAINALVGLWLRPRVNAILAQVEPASRDLKLLSEVMARLEAEQFQSAKLVSLRASLDTGGHPPSAQIAQLYRLMTWLDARMNQLFRPISAPFFWTSQFAFAVEAWRLRSGVKVERWIAAVGEIEALMALANYSYEHPADPFAEIVEGGLLYDAERIGHPLLPEEKVVRTDLQLSNDLRLLVVSGSNMSGKSTLLRTVGTNAVLALAGAPVRAKRLRLSPLQLGASIRIQDNLRAGASLFYAEITRLRQLMEMTGQSLPLLFIIDEILHGTNSHDRRIGSEAVLRGLVERGAIGLVTTHDLALTNIVAEANSRARNVHFEDHLENGKMTFDYILREGVVKKSNAIELMRSVGLEV
ncbi:MAG: DNA mismatch repair protein MutS [Blastocatellia bacterium]|nr:DNA mismatch repair protein MutS [Blastocatellia bacterium]